MPIHSNWHVSYFLMQTHRFYGVTYWSLRLISFFFSCCHKITKKKKKENTNGAMPLSIQDWSKFKDHESCSPYSLLCAEFNHVAVSSHVQQNSGEILFLKFSTDTVDHHRWKPMTPFKLPYRKKILQNTSRVFTPLCAGPKASVRFSANKELSTKKMKSCHGANSKCTLV